MVVTAAQLPDALSLHPGRRKEAATYSARAALSPGTSDGRSVGAGTLGRPGGPAKMGGGPVGGCLCQLRRGGRFGDNFQ
eukprot:362836-Chlamydomonas_euryale.AAC.21